jgi:demethylmenaquinone methyltransferase/2-methoxy-6-polyprenyl-1,4-benzoquinol methylase
VTADPRQVLDEQLGYYRARAPEYDDYYTRAGQFDQGATAEFEWSGELDEATRAMPLDRLEGDVLEIAAGTGWWTALLAQHAHTVAAIDAAPEMLEVNAERTAQLDNVQLIEADVFAFEPGRTFDTIFFAFWLSHVPLALFDEFWSRVASWLSPDGRAIFIDNLESSAPSIQERPTEDESELMQRTLKDGRQFTIVKRVWTPDTLRRRLTPAWRVDADATEHFFLYGTAAPMNPAPA